MAFSLVHPTGQWSGKHCTVHLHAQSNLTMSNVLLATILYIHVRTLLYAYTTYVHIDQHHSTRVSNLSASGEGADTESDDGSKSLFGIRISWDAVDRGGMHSHAVCSWPMGVLFCAIQLTMHTNLCMQTCLQSFQG